MAESKDLFQLLADELQETNLVKSQNYNDLVSMVNERVQYLIHHEPDLLMSYLYRLDIEENKIRTLFKSADQDVVHSISVLIIKRQFERVRTKRLFKQNPIKGWEW